MIIINHMKIDFNKWLNKYNKYSDISINDILIKLFNDFSHIIDPYDDICFINTYDMFNKFRIHIYNEFIKPNNNNKYIITNPDSDYIELLCNDSIIDLYMNYRDAYASYGLPFDDYNSYPLLMFLIQNTELINQDEDYSSNEDDDDDYYYYYKA